MTVIISLAFLIMNFSLRSSYPNRRKRPEQRLPSSPCQEVLPRSFIPSRRSIGPLYHRPLCRRRRRHRRRLINHCQSRVQVYRNHPLQRWKLTSSLTRSPARAEYQQRQQQQKKLRQVQDSSALRAARIVSLVKRKSSALKNVTKVFTSCVSW